MTMAYLTVQCSAYEGRPYVRIYVTGRPAVLCAQRTLSQSYLVCFVKEGLQAVDF